MLGAPSSGRVVVVAMKTQLRGRFRRTVTTLLEEGAKVTVLALNSENDFLLGLNHSDLEIELLEPSSFYLQLVNKQRGIAKKRKARRSTRHRPRLLAARNVGHRVQAQPQLFKFKLVKVLGALTPHSFWFKMPAEALNEGDGEKQNRSSRSSGRFRKWIYSAERASPDSRLVSFMVELLYRLKQSGREAQLWGRRGARTLRRSLWSRVRRAFYPLHRTTRYLDFWRLARIRAYELAPALVLSSDLPGLVPAAVVSRRLNIAHVHDCHEFYLGSTSFRPTEVKFLEPIERRYMRRATKIVFVNDSVRDEYRNRSMVDGTTVRNCADFSDSEDGLHLPTITGSRPGDRLVLYQGGFTSGRGLDVVIRALPLFPPATHLVMMGYGPLKEELMGLAASLRVQQNVSFVEAVPPSMLLRTAATATIGVIPYQPVSLNNKLALPNKIFEYTSAGLPVVVAAIPELERIARSGVGLSYDPFSPEGLAQAVATILDPLTLDQARSSAQKWAANNSWGVERQVLIEVWRSALGSQV